MSRSLLDHTEPLHPNPEVEEIGKNPRLYLLDTSEDSTVTVDPRKWYTVSDNNNVSISSYPKNSFFFYIYLPTRQLTRTFHFLLFESRVVPPRPHLTSLRRLLFGLSNKRSPRPGLVYKSLQFKNEGRVPCDIEGG